MLKRPLFFAASLTCWQCRPSPGGAPPPSCGLRPWRLRHAHVGSAAQTAVYKLEFQVYHDLHSVHGHLLEVLHHLCVKGGVRVTIVNSNRTIIREFRFYYNLNTWSQQIREYYKIVNLDLLFFSEVWSGSVTMHLTDLKSAEVPRMPSLTKWMREKYSSRSFCHSTRLIFSVKEPDPLYFQGLDPDLHFLLRIESESTLINRIQMQKHLE